VGVRTTLDIIVLGTMKVQTILNDTVLGVVGTVQRQLGILFISFVIRA